MQKFNKRNKIIDLVDANYHLLPVINRFGINLGNKDRTLERICKDHNVDIDFFLVIINTFHDADYFPEAELKSFSPLLIIDYLKKTHQHYLTYVLPKLDHLLSELIAGNRSEIHQLDVIVQFYEKYKKELLMHIQEEEKEVFPFVSAMVSLKKKLPSYSIHTFEEEHSNVDIKLNDLKSLIVKYVEPVYDNNICNEFLISLLRFENDIKNHARIEDKVLIPQVIEIERQMNE